MSTVDTITLRFEHEFWEYMHAGRVYQRSTRKHQVYKVIGLFCLFAAAWTVLRSGMGSITVVWLVIGIFAWLDPFPMFMVWMTYQGNPRLHKPCTAVFDNHETHFVVDNQRFTRKWNQYSGVIESKRVFLLVYGVWGYAVIPKRIFSNPDDLQAFRELVSQRIASSPKASIA